LTETQPWHHRWQNIDQTADPGWYIRFLDATRRGTIAQIQANAAEYYSFLAPAPGLRLLDVGSGTGTLLAPLAPLLLPGGSIIGIDLSAVMVEEASRRSREQGLPIQFQVGDVAHLEFPDASFDRATANQVFVHLDDPGRALREMVRVTRPDGLVAIWEADWETMMLDAGDHRVTRRIMNFLCDNLPQGWIGRMLPRLFAAAGLTDIHVQPETVILPGPVWNDQQYGFGLLPEFAEAAGIITSAERLDWQVNVEGRIRDGGPFVAFTAFRVVGRRPR
jgi:ubiquinone/menaquinone biosynthesis C-methylase UbiE